MHAIWGHIVMACKLYKKLPDRFPEWLYHVKSSSAKYEQYSFSASSPAFGAVTIFYFSHFDRYVVSMWLL